MKRWCTSGKRKGKGQHGFLAHKIVFQLEVHLHAFRDSCDVWNQIDKYKANEHLQNWKVGQNKLLPEKYVDQKPISSLPVLEIQRLLSSCQQNGWWEFAREPHAIAGKNLSQLSLAHMSGTARALNCTLSLTTISMNTLKIGNANASSQQPCTSSVRTLVCSLSTVGVTPKEMNWEIYSKLELRPMN